MSHSDKYLGKTTTLSPVVIIDLLKGANPVDVCGFLCTADAPAHASRGVCKKFYVEAHQIESPHDNLITHTATCTFMNEDAIHTHSLPGNSAWQDFTATVRQRYVYDAYSIIHPPSPPPSPPPPSPPSCNAYTNYDAHESTVGWANALFELTNGAAAGSLGSGFTRQVLQANAGTWNVPLVEKCCAACFYGSYDGVSYTFHSDQTGNNVATCASFEFKFATSASFGYALRSLDTP